MRSNLWPLQQLDPSPNVPVPVQPVLPPPVLKKGITKSVITLIANLDLSLLRVESTLVVLIGGIPDRSLAPCLPWHGGQWWRGTGSSVGAIERVASLRVTKKLRRRIF